MLNVRSRSRGLVPRQLWVLFLVSLGSIPALNSTASAQDAQTSDWGSPDVVYIVDAYNTEFDPEFSFADEIAIVDPGGYWPVSRSASDPDDPTARYQMLVLEFDLTEVDPQFTEDAYVFYYLDGEPLDEPAYVAAYAPARSSAQASIGVPQRLHSWRRKANSEDNPLLVTYAVRQALDRGADSLELVVYTTQPVRLSAAAPAPLMVLADAETLDLPVEDNTHKPNTEEGRAAAADGCKYCQDSDSVGTIRLSICGPTCHVCGDSSTYTIHVWGSNDSSGDLEIDFWEDDPFDSEHIWNPSWISVASTFDVTRTRTIDVCSYESVGDSPAELVAEFELHEGGANDGCHNWHDELLVTLLAADRCCSDSNCSPPTPYCSLLRRCVQCTQNSHCNDNNPCTNDSCSGGSCQYPREPGEGG